MTPTNTAVDPVCGMTVQPDAAAATREVDGTTYHFCSARCAATLTPTPTGTPSPSGSAPATPRRPGEGE
ncbi:YHS domain-containing protein [Luedemannella flava]